MNRLFKVLLAVTINLFTFVASAQKVVKKYVQKYEGMAIERMKEYQIPASIILGVSIVESGAGQSDLARIFHNYFGIKGKNHDAKKRLGHNSLYKEYASDTASYDHFCKVLAKKKFYQKLKGNMDFTKWLNQMNAAQYSEAKEIWVHKIAATINKFKLYKYDEQYATASDL